MSEFVHCSREDWEAGADTVVIFHAHFGTRVDAEQFCGVWFADGAQPIEEQECADCGELVVTVQLTANADRYSAQAAYDGLGPQVTEFGGFVADAAIAIFEPEGYEQLSLDPLPPAPGQYGGHSHNGHNGDDAE